LSSIAAVSYSVLIPASAQGEATWRAAATDVQPAILARAAKYNQTTLQGDHDSAPAPAHTPSAQTLSRNLGEPARGCYV
jgi:hypothetical protein